MRIERVRGKDGVSPYFKEKQWKSCANILSSLSSLPDLAEGRINVLTESSLYSQRRLQRRFIQEFSGQS